MCYLASWGVYRPTEGGPFQVFDLDPHLCTHIVIAFQGITENEDTLYSRDDWGDNKIYDIGQ